MQNLQSNKNDDANKSDLSQSQSRKVAKSTNIPHFNAQSCDQITQASNSNFISSFKFLPKEKTDALTKIYAFFRIADDCVDELESSEDKQIALNYWKGELLKIYRNESAHPVMEELKIVILKYQIPENYFTGLIDGCQNDITKFRYETFQDLYDYCYKVAGLVGLTCLKIFEYDSPTSKQMAIDLGLAFQLTNIIRDIQSDLKLNRIYLAKEDMLNFSYTEQELINGIENQAFQNLMAYYANKAENYYQSAFAEFKKDKDNKLIAAKIMARVYHQILKKIQKKHFHVFDKKISLNFIEKLYLVFPFFLKRRVS